MATKLCRNDVQTVRCRISVVISFSAMTCHLALVLERRRRVGPGGPVVFILATGSEVRAFKSGRG